MNSESGYVENFNNNLIGRPVSEFICMLGKIHPSLTIFLFKHFNCYIIEDAYNRPWEDTGEYDEICIQRANLKGTSIYNPNIPFPFSQFYKALDEIMVLPYSGLEEEIRIVEKSSRNSVTKIDSRTLDMSIRVGTDEGKYLYLPFLEFPVMERKGISKEGRLGMTVHTLKRKLMSLEDVVVPPGILFSSDNSIFYCGIELWSEKIWQNWMVQILGVGSLLNRDLKMGYSDRQQCINDFTRANRFNPDKYFLFPVAKIYEVPGFADGSYATGGWYAGQNMETLDKGEIVLPKVIALINN